MKQQVVIIFCILTLLQSCKANNNSVANAEFIEKHGNENFEDFRNYSVSLRSFDWDNNPIILVYNDTAESDDCQFPYRVIIDKESRNVKSFDRIQTDSNSVCQIDTALVVNLALKFELFKIMAIDIDENSNVHLKTTYFEGLPDLIRFSDLKYKTEEYKHWKHIQDNWYELPR